MTAKRLKPRDIADALIAGDAAQDSEFVRAEDYDALRAERDALRDDAERYRWMKQDALYDDAMRYRYLRNGVGGVGTIAQANIDAAIDAARKEDKT